MREGEGVSEGGEGDEVREGEGVSEGGRGWFKSPIDLFFPQAHHMPGNIVACNFKCCPPVGHEIIACNNCDVINVCLRNGIRHTWESWTLHNTRQHTV